MLFFQPVLRPGKFHYYETFYLQQHASAQKQLLFHAPQNPAAEKGKSNICRSRLLWSWLGETTATPPHSLITSKIHAAFEYYLRVCQRQEASLTDRALNACFSSDIITYDITPRCRSTPLSSYRRAFVKFATPTAEAHAKTARRFHFAHEKFK